MQLVFDLSTLARSGGQAVGIVRVVRELARRARARDRVVFVLYDSGSQCFRQVKETWLVPIIEGTLSVDHSDQPDREGARPKLRHRLRGPLRQAALWLRNPRRRTIGMLERSRIGGGPMAGIAARLQNVLLTGKYLSELTDSAGRRRTILPFDVVAGAVVTLGGNDVILCPGSDWGSSAMSHVEAAKAASGVRVASICYDTVTLIHPDFYEPGLAELSRRMFERITALADVIFVTASSVAAEVRERVAASGRQPPDIRIFALGADLPVPDTGPAALPAGLEPQRYALFVATIEPRKGHRLMFSVWKRLLEEGIPHKSGFRLVFLGRRGWLVDDLMAEIEAHPSYGSSLLVLKGVNDAELANLYRNAAFCVLPSLYEGYGLPVVESFRYGKAVLSSNAGALPEIVGDLSPMIDPADEGSWFEAMRRWVVDPEARCPYEEAIRQRFRHPTWGEAADAFFEKLDAAFEGPVTGGSA